MKKFLKRSILVLLAALLLAQIPFIYRRYKTGRLAEKIAALNVSRTVRADETYKEYKGIIHAHTNIGGHSTGTFDEIIDAANANDLDFVLLTEHYSDKFDSSALTLNGIYGRTLFVGGHEADTADGDRFLLIPGSPETANFRNLTTPAFLDKVHSESRLAFVTYPEKFKSWHTAYDGIEVFSLHTNAKQMNPYLALFDLIWTYPAYPGLMLASGFKRPDANLQKFDEAASARKISLFAGSDAHSNIGFHLFGDDAGHKPINIKLDPYMMTFQLARLHVLIEKAKPFSRETLLEAIRAGHTFVGFDVLGDSTGFSFTAQHATGRSAMGVEVPSSPDLTLSVSAPLPARFVYYRNGVAVAGSADGPETTGRIIPNQPGIYRVEAYLDELGPPFDRTPWIMSNPIYVR
jgi:hypothetical protein